MNPPVEEMRKPHERKLGTGKEHGMKPVTFPHPNEIHTFGDLTKAMGETTAGARDLGKAVEVVKAMMADEGCTVVLTLSGNATPFTTLIAELIDRKIVHAVVSTGSIVTHTFSAERGRPMFQIEDPDAIDDNWFYNRGYNRIYDVVELESSLNEGYDLLRSVTDTMIEDASVSSADITKAIGKQLNEKFPEPNGLLHAAERAGVPIFIPAFSDCEVGLDFHAQNLERRAAGKPEVLYSAFKDLEQYCAVIKAAKTVGVLELGGGVPRNWAQQVGPFFDILTAKKMEPKDLIVRIKYAVRICSAPGTEGGLSGCGFAEGRSWGKFLDEQSGGMNAEIVGDYSLAFPLLCAAVLEDNKTA
jgi:deoxyhypusine synthase